MKQNYGGLKYKALTQEIIGVFYEVYNELGHGLETLLSTDEISHEESS